MSGAPVDQTGAIRALRPSARPRRRLAAAALVLLVLGGCSDDGGSASLQLGEDATVGEATATVEAVELLEPDDPPDPDLEHVLAAEVAVCGPDEAVREATFLLGRGEEAEAPTDVPEAVVGDREPIDLLAGPGDDGCAAGWVFWPDPPADAVIVWDADPGESWPVDL